MNGRKMRAAVYCRIYPDRDIFTQLTERIHEAQMKFSPNWECRGFYIDLLGNSTAYAKMREDEKYGKFDVIVTTGVTPISRHFSIEPAYCGGVAHE